MDSPPLTTHHVLLEKEPKGDVSVSASAERSSKKQRTADEQAAANAVVLGMFASDNLKAAWRNFQEYRQLRANMPLLGERPAPWTLGASAALARKLEQISQSHGDKVATECAETAIARRWLDIFPPEQRKPQTTKTNHGSATNPDEYQ